MSIADMLIERGRTEGGEEGLEKGEMIGRVLTLERVLKMEESARPALQRMSLAQLRERVAVLERQIPGTI